MGKRVVIVHGYKGKPETNWKPWLKHELEANGHAATIPEMPNTDNPNALAWVGKLAEIVGEPDEDMYLIGHSLGCITILRYLETLHQDQKIRGAILVAGFGEKFQKYHGGHDSFFDHELNWQTIREHCSKFIAIHSDDDPNVEYEQLGLLGQRLHAKAIGMHGMGHFGSADGVYEIPVVRDELLALS
jgi:predicted alpha/beta hydrolase family esterase